MNRRNRSFSSVLWRLAVITGFSGCLSGDSLLGNDESELVTAGGEGGSGIDLTLATPPGEIVDTQPDSGWTEGSFSVSHDGVAQYQLPLWVPDGRGGVQPDLSLRYSSNGGNGLLGVGWSLTGLSTIAPCPRTRAEDGRSQAVSSPESTPTAWTAPACG